MATIALIGAVASTLFVWMATNATLSTAGEANRQIETVLAALGSTEPLLARESDGRVVRRRQTQVIQPAPVSRIVVLSYRVESGRLIRSQLALLVFRVKAPAAQIFLRDTGLDLQALGLTASDLVREGPTLVLRETSASGNRLLIWTE